jgi:uncharacterized membrane protein
MTMKTKTTLAKTVSYRAVSMAVTMMLAYGMTGSFKSASVLGLANLTVNSSVYFAFEKVWAAATGRL